VYHNTVRKLYSAGRTGLSEILRMSMTIFTHLFGPQQLCGDDHIETFFSSLFESEEAGIRDVFKDFPPRLSEDYERNGYYGDHISNYRRLGAFLWRQCVISTPSSSVRYSGPKLFRNYARSAAFDRLENRDFEGAKEFCAQAAIETWNYGDEWDQLEAICAMENNFDIMLQVAETIVTNHPMERNAWEKLFYAYGLSNDVQGALQCFNTAVAEQNFICLHAFSFLLQSKEPFFRETIGLSTLEPEQMLKSELNTCNSEGFWRFVGTVYETKDDKDKAIQAYEKAKSLAMPNEAPLYQVQLIDLYRQQKRFDEVLRLIEEMPSLWYGRVRKLRIMADVCAKNGDLDAGIERIQAEVVKMPHELDLQLLLAEVYMKCSDHEAAIAAYEAVIDEEVQRGECPDSIWMDLGHAKLFHGDLLGAIQALEIALAGDPSDKHCWRCLETAYWAVGNHVGYADARRRAKERVCDYES
jgi:tetratricopeptide (TPR) repeat protein